MHVRFNGGEINFEFFFFFASLGMELMKSISPIVFRFFLNIVHLLGERRAGQGEVGRWDGRLTAFLT